MSTEASEKEAGQSPREQQWGQTEVWQRIRRCVLGESCDSRNVRNGTLAGLNSQFYILVGDEEFLQSLCH